MTEVKIIEISESGARTEKTESPSRKQKLDDKRPAEIEAMMAAKRAEILKGQK